MNERLLNILNETDEPADQMLEHYLKGTMNEADRSDFEARLAADPMLRDALDGFCEANAPHNISRLSAQLNKQMLKRLKLKNRKKKILLSPLQLSIIALLMILAILLIAYLMIYRIQQG